MPCRCEEMDPNRREQESVKVLGFLKEIGLDYKSGGPISGAYGRVATVDADTAALCAWCEANPDKIGKKSLELQIWWRDHQLADAARAQEERDAAAKRTAALIVFGPGTDPEQARRFLVAVSDAAKSVSSTLRIERIQTQLFDPQLGNVVIYQP